MFLLIQIKSRYDGITADEVDINLIYNETSLGFRILIFKINEFYYHPVERRAKLEEIKLP